MSYFFQEKDWGLGNFIMATPMIQLQSKKNSRPVPTFFSDKNIASLYKDASFIKILSNKPAGPPKFGSSRHPKARRKNESDSHAYCRIHLNHTGPIPGTYVDRPDPSEYLLERRQDRKHIAVFHGCLGTVFRNKKDLGPENRQMIIDNILKAGMAPVIIGSPSDVNNFWKHNRLKHCLNFAGSLPLRDSVCILSQCDAFVSNDTGLYHVASAFDMQGLVLWHKTDLVKNRSLCQKIVHVQSNNINNDIYKESLYSFLESLK